MIRGALVALLRLEDDIEVVANLERGDGVVEAAERTRPDVAVLDIDMPGMDGLAVSGGRHHDRPDRHQALAVTCDRPQLPVHRHHQGRRPQPHRRDPYRPRRRMALSRRSSSR
jgi:CheY-like chemotaxis protein